MNTHIDSTRLKQAIKEAGYTLDEFHRELGIAKTTFYYYRMGVRSIPHELRERIETLLHCPFHTFIRSESENTLIVLSQKRQQRAQER